MLVRCTRCPRVAMAAILLIQAACGGDGGTSPKPANEVAATGGTVVAQNGTVALSFPAGAVATPTTITVAPRTDPTGNPNLVAGSAYEFGPDGLQFAQPVKLDIKYDASKLPANTSREQLRIAKLVGNAWVPVDEGVVVDSARGTVSANIRSFSAYSIVADPCVAVSIKTGTVSGDLRTSDCVDPASTLRSRADFFTLPAAAAGQVVKVQSSGSVSGLVAIKVASSDPRQGHYWVATRVGNTVKVVSNGSALQAFVIGDDSTKTGTYSLTTTLEAAAHECNSAAYLTVGASVSQSLTAGNSCQYTVQFTNVPAAMGKPLLAHVWGARLEAGRTYNVSVSGFAGTFKPALTIFRASSVVTQSLDMSASTTSRSLTFTPSTTGYYTIELASGYFLDPSNMSTWSTPSGSYTLVLTGS